MMDGIQLDIRFITDITNLYDIIMHHNYHEVAAYYHNMHSLIMMLCVHQTFEVTWECSSLENISCSANQTSCMAGLNNLYMIPRLNLTKVKFNRNRSV